MKDDLTLEAMAKMNKAIDQLNSSLATLRTGRASASMLNNVMVDYYGCPTPLNQISSISVPEARQLIIKPYDKNDVKNIIAAINASDIGINPVSDGAVVRLTIPPLTEDRRREISKQAHKYGEEAKIVVRNIRRDTLEFIKINDEMSEDYQKRVSDEVQGITDESTKAIDNIVAEKEKEIMTI